MPRTTKETSKELKDKKTKVTAKKANTNKTNVTKKSSSKSVVENKKSTSSKATSVKSKTTTTKKAATNTTKKKSSTVKNITEKKTAKKKEPIYILEYYDLPYRYNQTVVKVLAQTPTTLFVYWDISDDDRANYISQYGENFFETTKPVLVIHNETMNYTYEVEINDFANSWYLHINDSNCKYYMELGRRTKDNYSEYIPITNSNQTYSPNDHVLFNSLDINGLVKYRNVKSQKTFHKVAASFIPNMSKIYNIYDLYKLLYKDDFELVKDAKINNPSSGNISSFK